MDQLFNTQNLVEAGAVVIALVSIGLNYKLVSNHINHNTEVMAKLTEAIEHLVQRLEK